MLPVAAQSDMLSPQQAQGTEACSLGQRIVTLSARPNALVDLQGRAAYGPREAFGAGSGFAIQAIQIDVDQSSSPNHHPAVNQYRVHAAIV